MSFYSKTQKETRWLTSVYIIQRYVVRDWIEDYTEGWDNLGFINFDKEKVDSLNLMFQSKDDRDKIMALSIIKENEK